MRKGVKKYTIILIFSVFINLLQKNDPKSILGFRFWTFFLSIFEKGRFTFEKNEICD